uniref:DDE-1 domain-containing protein n=1 Tax=Latimeria chalumnae TaxID=7897 RepID=H3B163_LATCH
TPRHSTVFTDEEEMCIVKHLKVVVEWGFPFDLLDIRVLARTYLDKQGRSVSQFQNNLLSTDWARNFVKCHKKDLTTHLCQNIKSTRANVSADIVKQFFQNMKETLQNEDSTPIPPQNIYNFDETNLSDDPETKKCVFKRGIKFPERIRNSTKAAISIMFCGSATGEMLPAYVIYKAEHIWSTWTEGGPKYTRYNCSKNGWFDANCFADWFATMSVPHAKLLPGQKVLTGDNLSSHFNDTVLTRSKENNVPLHLPPNSTHLMQLLDVAFYGLLKRSWRKVLDKWKASTKRKSQTLTKDSFPYLLKQLYKVVYPSETGTETSENLVSGFRKCGIYPLDVNQVLKSWTVLCG